MLDPLVGAVCTLAEIDRMTDEMLVAGEKWLPQYKDEIRVARQRLKQPPAFEQKPYTGAVRLHTKTVDEMEAEKRI